MTYDRGKKPTRLEAAKFDKKSRSAQIVIPQSRIDELKDELITKLDQKRKAYAAQVNSQNTYDQQTLENIINTQAYTDLFLELTEEILELVELPLTKQAKPNKFTKWFDESKSGEPNEPTYSGEEIKMGEDSQGAKAEIEHEQGIATLTELSELLESQKLLISFLKNIFNKPPEIFPSTFKELLDAIQSAETFAKQSHLIIELQKLGNQFFGDTKNSLLWNRVILETTNENLNHKLNKFLGKHDISNHTHEDSLATNPLEVVDLLRTIRTALKLVNLYLQQNDIDHAKELLEKIRNVMTGYKNILKKFISSKVLIDFSKEINTVVIELTFKLANPRESRTKIRSTNNILDGIAHQRSVLKQLIPSILKNATKAVSLENATKFITNEFPSHKANFKLLTSEDIIHFSNTWEDLFRHSYKYSQTPDLELTRDATNHLQALQRRNLIIQTKMIKDPKLIARLNNLREFDELNGLLESIDIYKKSFKNDQQYLLHLEKFIKNHLRLLDYKLEFQNHFVELSEKITNINSSQDLEAFKSLTAEIFEIYKEEKDDDAAAELKQQVNSLMTSYLDSLDNRIELTEKLKTEGKLYYVTKVGHLDELNNMISKIQQITDQFQLQILQSAFPDVDMPIELIIKQLDEFLKASELKDKLNKLVNDPQLATEINDMPYKDLELIWKQVLQKFGLSADGSFSISQQEQVQEYSKEVIRDYLQTRAQLLASTPKPTSNPASPRSPTPIHYERARGRGYLIPKQPPSSSTGNSSAFSSSSSSATKFTQLSSMESPHLSEEKLPLPSFSESSSATASPSSGSNTTTPKRSALKMTLYGSSDQTPSPKRTATPGSNSKKGVSFSPDVKNNERPSSRFSSPGRANLESKHDPDRPPTPRSKK